MAFSGDPLSECRHVAGLTQEQLDDLSDERGVASVD